MFSITSILHDGSESSRVETKKRTRTIFTEEQLQKLEAHFEKQQYIVGENRVQLAKELNLTELQIKVWFQNRRIKWRKQLVTKEKSSLVEFSMNPEIQVDWGK